MQRLPVLIFPIVLSTFLTQTVWSEDQAPTLQQALGAAYLARAELALLKRQLNEGISNGTQKSVNVPGCVEMEHPLVS